MKKRVFALFLASLLAISQVGAALSETADLTVEPTATVVISTPAPTLQAIIEALVENTTEPTPEVTEEPGDETEEPGDETEELGDETEEPGDEGTETVPTAFSVKVEVVTVKDVYYVGDTIRIESSITGTCYAPVYQWQVDKGDGEWKDIEDATDWYYEYEIDMDNCSWLYRVVICDAEAVEG